MDKKILVATANSDTGKKIQSILLEKGYRVPDPVKNGEEVIFKLGKMDPDLIVLDLQLPGAVTGLDAAREIHNNYQIPVVYLSPQPDPAEDLSFLNNYFSRRLTVPIQENLLELIVMNAFEIHSLETELIQRTTRFERMQRMAKLGFWEWDREQAFVKISKSLVEILGLGEQELSLDQGQIREHIHPEDIGKVRELVASSWDDFLAQQDTQIRMLDGEGKTRVFQSSPISIEKFDQENNPRVLVGALYDITAQYQLEEERRKRETYLDLITNITSTALGASTLEDVYQRLVAEVTEFFGCESCTLMLFDEEYGLFNPAAVSGDHGQTALVGEFLHPDKWEEILTKNQPVVLGSGESGFLSKMFSSSEQMQYLALPLVSGGKEIGVCLLGFSADSHLGDELLQEGEQLAGQLALTLAKTMLLEDFRDTLVNIEAAGELGHTLLHTSSWGEVLEDVYIHLKKIIPCDHFSIFKRENQILKQVGQRGEIKFNESEIALNHPLIKPAVEFSDISIISSWESSPEAERVLKKVPFESCLVIPLITEQSVRGVILVGSNQQRAYSSRQFGNLRIIANQTALAVQKIHLIESEQNQVYITRTLQQVSSLLATGIRLDEALSTILQLLERVVRYDQAYLVLLNDQGVLQLAASRPQVDQMLYTQFFENYSELIKNRFRGRSDQPIVFSDVKRQEDWVDSSINNQIRSTIHAPLIHRGEIFGFIFIDSEIPDSYNRLTGQTVMGFANQASLAIANVRLFERNQKLALLDELTGVYNRRYLMRIGKNEVKRAKRFQEPLSVIILDFDNFKSINDTYGHKIGDDVIREVIDRARLVIRDIDILARYGGDEFVILLAKGDIDVAEQVGQRLHAEINQKQISTQRGDIQATISMGAAEMNQNYDSLEKLLMAADDALYLAKRDGRSCFRIG